MKVDKQPSPLGDSLKSPAIALAVLAAIAASFLPQSSQAASINWTGGTSVAWATGTNWTGAIAPANNLTVDSAVFGGTYTFQPTAPTNRNIGSILITGGNTNPLTITTGTSTGRLNVGGGGITMEAGSAAVNIGTAATQGVRLGAATVAFQNDSSSLLTISSVGNANTGAHALTLAGSGSGGITITDVLTNGTIVGATTSLTVNMSGTGVATLSSIANDYTLGTTITAGTLNTGASGKNLGSGAVLLNGGNLTLNSSGVGNLTGITSFTQATGSTAFDLLSLSSFDSIAGGGSFTISGGTFVLTGTLVGDETDSYAIFTGFTGNSVSGVTYDTTGLTNLGGRTPTLDAATGVLTFTAVPEPQTIALALMGLFVTVFAIRRRKAPQNA